MKLKLRRESWSEDLIEVWLEGWVEGWVEGYISALTEDVGNIKKYLGLSNERVKETMGISDDEWELIAGQI